MSTHATNAIVQTAKLVTLGDAIRAKAGLSEEMTLDEMAAAVANIETGGNYQSKTVAPSTSQQTVTPDSGYDALSSVTVNAMPSGSATTPATSITANPTISVSASGLITASVSGSQSVTPSVSAGYVASGTAGAVSVSGSNTQQLTVYNGEHHQPVQQVEVQINSEGAYTVSLPSGASQSGNIVTIDPNGTFTIYGSFDLDMTSTDGTVTRQIVSIGSGTFEILVDAGASGGSISLYEMM